MNNTSTSNVGENRSSKRKRKLIRLPTQPRETEVKSLQSIKVQSGNTIGESSKEAPSDCMKLSSSQSSSLMQGSTTGESKEILSGETILQAQPTSRVSQRKKGSQKRDNTTISESRQLSIEDMSSLDLSKTINIPSLNTIITNEDTMASNLRIEIVANISPDTVIYHDHYFNTNNVLNNYSKLLQFVQDCPIPITGANKKASIHIQVEGYARSGKTTISSIILPYLLSKYKFNTYPKYRTIVFDALTFNRRRSQKVQIDEFLLQLLQYELKVPPPPLPLSTGQYLFWQQWLHEHLDMETFYFFCFDEIQVLTEFEMEELKSFFKSGFCPSNMLAIVTGSSQSMVLKRIASVRSNGFSLQESVKKFTIPKGLSIHEVQDTITALRSTIPKGYLTMDLINNLCIVFREIHPAHLSIMHQDGLSVEQLVDAYQDVYYRDFPFLTNKELTVDDEKVIKYLLQGDFSSIDPQKRKPDDFVYYFEKTDVEGQFRLRDLILDNMLHCHFMIDSTFGKVFRREPSSSTHHYFFYILLPLLEYGENISQINRRNCLRGITKPEFAPPAQAVTLLKEGLELIDSHHDIENSFNGVVIGARNIVFHNCTKSEDVFNLFLKLWFNKSKPMFQTFLIHLIEVNSINDEYLVKFKPTKKNKYRK